MENLNDVVANTKKPTAKAVQDALVANAEIAVSSTLSDEDTAKILNLFYGCKDKASGFKWYEVKNAKDSTEEKEKELWVKFQNPYYKALRTAFKTKTGKDLSNPSTYWLRIKNAGKGLVEGTRKLGKGADKTPEDRLLIATHPRWAEYARLEEPTHRQTEIQDLLSQLIFKIGHDPQKVDLVKLGLKKS